MSNAKTASSSVRSMTGQGHARAEGPLGTIAAEIRTVNNRGFKCVLRLADALGSFESQIESTIRTLMRRGSVYVNVSWNLPAADSLPQVDQQVLASYCQQLQLARESLPNDVSLDLASLMLLPGVIVSGKELPKDNDEVWEFVRGAIQGAMENLNEMRSTEGANMAASLNLDCAAIRDRIESISELAGKVAETYRTRLETKIKRTLAEHGLEIETIDILKEVQIYADRSDISEEITRLDSHLSMFASVLESPVEENGAPEPVGRKLDFIIQEMFRETNTIGSKASDAAVSAHVVEIKCAIERMRELVQNLE